MRWLSLVPDDSIRGSPGDKPYPIHHSLDLFASTALLLVLPYLIKSGFNKLASAYFLFYAWNFHMHQLMNLMMGWATTPPTGTGVWAAENVAGSLVLL